jgi:hypothetical protein
MPKQPKQPEADMTLEELARRMLNTPPKPHTQKKKAKAPAKKK